MHTLDVRVDVDAGGDFKIRTATAGGGRSWVFRRLLSCPVNSCTGYRNSVPGLCQETGRKVINDFELILCRQNCSKGESDGANSLDLEALRSNVLVSAIVRSLLRAESVREASFPESNKFQLTVTSRGEEGDLRALCWGAESLEGRKGKN